MLTVPARTRTWPATAAVLFILAILWFVLGDSDLALFAAGIGYALAAVGVDVTTGYAGQPNFGQAAFMAIGSYSATALQAQAGLTFVESFVCALVLCALIATVLGLAAVRLEHLGFGIITFAFAFAVAAFIEGDTLAGITGGPNGLAIPTGTIFGNNMADPKPLYAFALIVLGVAVYIVHSFVSSRSGRAMLTAKGNERVAAVLGVETARVKLRAFAISAALGGAGGIIIGEGSGFVTPESFPAALSITVFGMAALGGMGTITGPMLGALFFWLVPSYVQALSTYQEVFVAGIFLLVLIVVPAGVVGFAADSIERSPRRVARILNRKSWSAAPGETKSFEPKSRSGGTTDADVLAPPQPGMPALRVSDVHVEFGGVRAVNGVSLEVLEGSCHGLVGPNGAGKTTLLNALSGVVRTDGGEIWLRGDRIDKSRPQRRRQLGLIRTFQNPALVGDLSAIDNVKVGLHQVVRWSAVRDMIGLGLNRRGELRITEGAAEALDAVGFPRARWNVPAAELSHGDQKIVDLARALACKPRVILLDEPTAGLTVSEMDNFGAVLKNQRETFGATMVIVSHHMRFLSDLADSLTVMDYGSVLARGEFDEVSRRPDVVAAFLGEYDAAI